MRAVNYKIGNSEVKPKPVKAALIIHNGMSSQGVNFNPAASRPPAVQGRKYENISKVIYSGLY